MGQGGIYQIKNEVNKKMYVGATINLDSRIYQHKRSLKRGSHYNKNLQSEFNENPKSFSFEKIKFLDNPEDLKYFENWYITIFQTFKREYGYNLTDYSGYSYVRRQTGLPVEEIASTGTIMMACRLNSRLSQKELAKALKISQSDISKYETNYKEPRISLFTNWMKETDNKKALVASIIGVDNNKILSEILSVK